MAIRDLIPWSRQETRVPVRTNQSDGHPLLTLHREVNRLFDDVFRSVGAPIMGGWGAGLEWPSVELSETEEEVRVTAELPGLDEKDVDISVDDGVLTLRGEKKSENGRQTPGILGAQLWPLRTLHRSPARSGGREGASDLQEGRAYDCAAQICSLGRKPAPDPYPRQLTELGQPRGRLPCREFENDLNSNDLAQTPDREIGDSGV